MTNANNPAPVKARKPLLLFILPAYPLSLRRVSVAGKGRCESFEVISAATLVAAGSRISSYPSIIYV